MPGLISPIEQGANKRCFGRWDVAKKLEMNA